MNINKANWYSKDGQVTMTMPFQKVDKESRTVSGFATLDNVDTHDDIVTLEGSLQAFSQFRGNLREMHQPIAVGKIKSFAPETLYDPSTGKYYNGVYVNAYVSKGASDTWEKVLDGTLSGFSIGGVVKDAEMVFNEDLKKSVQVIKELELYELSLVDNPANQFANIVSVQKVAGTEVETAAEHVYTCKKCRTVIASPMDSRDCPECSTAMTDIGWIERDTTVHKEIQKMVDAFYTSGDEPENNPLPETDEKTSEGEIHMANEEHVEEPVAEESEVEQPEAVAEEVVEPEAETVESVEAVAEDAEVEATDSDEGEAVAGAEEVEVSEFERITAELADLRTILEQIVSKTSEEVTAKATADVSKAFDEKIEALESKLTQAVESISKSINTVEKQIDAVAEATAGKKSGDLGSDPAPIKKSLWDGQFLGISSLEN
jgi:hypothetical protein